MQYLEREAKVEDLVNSFRAGQLLRNPEYQRGETWSNVQKASFIDSILREYPVPALFIHEVAMTDPYGERVVKHEIVDGQQRLSALRDFVEGKYICVPVEKLRLPKAVRGLPAPWAEKYYGDLDQTQKQRLNDTRIKVFQLGAKYSPDEVRDLFIRLQSGTTLSRQQKRDAWPGNIGPFIERLAGKLNRIPSTPLFLLVDKRGSRLDDEELKDCFVRDREVCAQLLRIFTERDGKPYCYPSVSARDLDSLYHEYADFDPAGPIAENFMECLKGAATVLREVRTLRPKKLSRLDVISLVMFMQDIGPSCGYRLSDHSAKELARRIVETQKEAARGKSTSGRTLGYYYDWWRENVANGIAVRQDQRRVFGDSQKSQIRERQGGKCAVCDSDVSEQEAEYDHFPVPHRDGGLTEVENGRLVHSSCHPRGRPSMSEWDDFPGLMD